MWAVLHKRKRSSSQIILFGFAGVILVGTLLLLLPFATNSGQGASFLDALFTSTSAVCVTGLIVQDTATYWSGFGQSVILLLIQIGGMGVITVAAAITMASGKKISLMQRSTMQDAISAPQVGGIVRFTGFILKGIFLFELLGALVLMCTDEVDEFVTQSMMTYAEKPFCNAATEDLGLQSDEDKKALEEKTEELDRPSLCCPHKLGRSTRYASFLPNCPAAIHHQSGAGNIAGGIGSQKCHRAFDVILVCPAAQGAIINIGLLECLFVRIVGKTGVKTAGGNAVDPDTVLAVTAGHILGHTHHCPLFRGVVDGLIAPGFGIKGEMGAIQTTHRADVDNAALFIGEHIGKHRLGKENLSVEIHADRILQFLPGGILQGGHISSVYCVVYQNVNTTEFLIDPMGKALDGCIVGQIQGHSPSFVALLPQRFGIFLAFFSVSGGDNHRGAHFA